MQILVKITIYIMVYRKSQTTEKLLPFPHCPSPESPTSVSSSLADIEEMAANININNREVRVTIKQEILIWYFKHLWYLIFMKFSDFLWNLTP